MSSIDIEYDLRIILQPLHLHQALGALLGNAPDMRGHIQKVLHLLRLRQCKMKFQRPAVKELKARQLRMQQLLFFLL